MKTPSRFAPSVQPAILTAIVVGVGALFVAFFPWMQVAMYFAVLPLPLLLLWISRDVASPQARIAACDAAHARHATV